MFLAVFEVHPRAERFDDYLALAKRLRPTLETIDGFVDNERFESRRRPGWILSLSTWRDEKSMVRWRTTGVHHIVQKQGRSEILEDYHLRIGDVTADTAAPRGAPVHEQRFDETEIGAKFATVTELTPEPDATFGSQVDLIAGPGLDVFLGLDVFQEGVIDYDVFASIYNPGKHCSFCGKMPKPAADGCPGNRLAFKCCATGVFESCATTACSIVGNLPSSFPMSRDIKRDTQNSYIRRLHKWRTVE
jgi:heme-degrading monooxygenase HmoA